MGDSSLIFERPELFWALLIVPFLILLFFRSRYIRNVSLKKYGDPALISLLSPEVSPYKPFVKIALASLGATFLIFGLINPQIGVKYEEVKREGADVIVAIDVSNSMLCRDVSPSRLDRAKREVSRLIDDLKGDRIGLVVFAGKAYLQLPLTNDYSAAKLFLDAINPTIVGVQGTAIGAAIDKSLQAFEFGVSKEKNDVSNKNKTLIIISDGENHEDDALGAAKKAAESGIPVHAIGIGSETGGPIPLNTAGTSFLKDGSGSTVVTRMDPALIRQLASAGKGSYSITSGGALNLKKFVDEIAGLEKRELGEKIITEYESRFQYFIVIALFFLAVDAFLSERKNKFVASLKLFESSK